MKNMQCLLMTVIGPIPRLKPVAPPWRTFRRRIQANERGREIVKLFLWHSSSGEIFLARRTKRLARTGRMAQSPWKRSISCNFFANCLTIKEQRQQLSFGLLAYLKRIKIYDFHEEGRAKIDLFLAS